MTHSGVDYEGLQRADVRKLYETETPGDIPFAASKISHVALRVADLERSVHFYTQVMGFRVSDAYPETMMPGGMAFIRCNQDHHGIALVGGAAEMEGSGSLHHFAFEVGTVDEVFRARDHLQRHGVPLHFEGRRRAGQQIAIEFQDPDGNNLEICWGMDRIAPSNAARPAEEWQAAATLEEAVRNPPPGQKVQLSDPSLMREGE